MLKIAHSLSELNFSKLMEVYAEGNVENGEYFFPEETPERQKMLAEERFGEYLREDFFRQKGACYAVLEEQGEYLSALRLEPYEDGLLLEALETKPNCRKKGYARELMRLTFARLPAGTKVYSHVSKRNEPSLAVHRACGFRVYLDYAVEVDGTVTRRCVTLAKQI